jgi:hypothetical protein
MPVLPDAVAEDALDYEEIFGRGGRNCGDEDFALCKCPHCGRIYLIEYEVDTIYLDASDLGRRESLFNITSFKCETCINPFPKGAWIGPKAPAEMQVTWTDLANSPWNWITKKQKQGATGDR